jgi:superfamily II RNA helicase
VSTPVFPLQALAEKATEGNALDLFLEYTFEKNLELYPAQEEAILDLYAGKNVILNTPTGSGKSLVAAALHFQSLTQKRKSIYTCPIKALVNEKFLGLCRDFGPDQVGMITGDATVNPDAPIICCTAEILSNLALRMGHLTPYHDIIMDEFHYYSDRSRGIAWQIPLLTLSKARFLLMSATLGDTSFFEKSLSDLTGLETAVVKSNIRPVPLDFEYSEKPLHAKIASLIEQGKTPIYLVNFTQRECAEEAQNLLSVDFCTKDEKKKILEQLEGVRFNSPYGKEIQKLLKHGIGLHHAGLLPRYRVLVERLAQNGLLKIICGTDTLGVGVNVPIRTVLFTKLCKYDGEKATLLSIRDFQQISGRAGRKGFDTEGSVVVQAPEHVIENLIIDQKAAEDPKKAKNKVKRKPPEKGYIPWTKDTLVKLSEGKPEALTSRFQVTHGMILNVLSREGTQNCDALRDLILKSHESEVQKKRHGKLAFQLFRSLYERNIVELNPLRIHVDLQADFSLNQSLSLYLIDAVKVLDPESETYALDILTLVESILENPDLILRRQVDRLKTAKMAELKAAGMEYDQRIEELEKIEYPKPNQDFIYTTFNAFAKAHPWVGAENIRPKSVAREMFETFQSFHEYVRDYDLERVEGLLLRYLTEVYKVLLQTVPDQAKTEPVLEVIEYFRTILKDIDSSLLEEWERLKNPALANTRAAEQDARDEIERLKSARKKQLQIEIRNQVFRGIRFLITSQFSEAAETLAKGSAEFTADYFENKMKEYDLSHERLLLDQKARSAHFTKLIRISDILYKIEQTLCDSEAHNDWILTAEVDVSSENRPSLRFIGFE